MDSSIINFNVGFSYNSLNPGTGGPKASRWQDGKKKSSQSVEKTHYVKQLG